MFFGEDVWPWRRVWGGCCLFLWGCKLNDETKKRGKNELALGGHCFIFRHNKQLIVGVSNGRDDGEVARLGWSVWKGSWLFVWGSKSNNNKKYKIEYDVALDG
jgi:hypothetical protein